MDDDKPQLRRDFFRDGLARLIGPLVELFETPTPRDETRTFLRPPGAIDESAFLRTCQRSGECLAACPATAIRWLHRPGNEASHHTPIVNPDIAACVVCDGLLCTHVCPSGALQPLAEPAQIRMGLAVVSEPQCLRSRRDPCTTCVDLCPVGEEALYFPDDGPPVVRADGCVGCGVCQQNCPTSPKAIIVQPW